MRDSRTESITLLFAAPTLIWGSTWLGIKYQLGVVAPDVSVAYRFALAALLLFGWCAATRRTLRFTARQHGWLLLQGTLLFGLNYVLVYWAEAYATSGLVAVLFSTIVFMNPIVARVAFGTPIASRTLAAAVLGVAGIALLFLPELRQAGRGGDAGLGVALGLAATAVASAGNMAAVRNNNAGLPVLQANAWGMAYGALAAALAAWLHGAAWTFDPHAGYVISLLYLALFGSIVAFGMYLTLLQRVGPSAGAYVGVAVPVVAMMLSTLAEGYRWSWIAVAGVALAVLGNIVALRAPRKPALA